MIDSVESAAPPPPARRGWPVHLAVAGVSLVAGVALTVAVLLLIGWRHVPVHRYDVTVQTERGTTVERRDEIGGTLAALFPGGDLKVQTREEIFERFRTEWEATNGELPDSVTAADSPELLTVSTDGRSFDCAVLADVKNLPGVAGANVHQVHGGTGRVSTIGCL